MQPILVAYGSTEGHTRKVAEFIAERLRLRGHRVDLVDTATPAAQEVTAVYQGAVLGGSLHQHRHQASLAHFIKSNHAWLSAMPVAICTAHAYLLIGCDVTHMDAEVSSSR